MIINILLTIIMIGIFAGTIYYISEKWLPSDFFESKKLKVTPNVIVIYSISIVIYLLCYYLCNKLPWVSTVMMFASFLISKHLKSENISIHSDPAGTGMEKGFGIIFEIAYVVIILLISIPFSHMEYETRRIVLLVFFFLYMIYLTYIFAMIKMELNQNR